jgi:xanthine dehydrogenase small subunit
MKNKIQFILNNKFTEIDFSKDSVSPTTTMLKYLRKTHDHKGVKEGCGEGDCGACTIVIADLDAQNNMVYKAYTSCLIFLPSIHGKQVITVEGIGTSKNLHPLQQALVDTDGSQCGYCTPGFTMSLFALYKNPAVPTKESILDSITGNLCRCTGYRPIIEAAQKSCTLKEKDSFSQNEKKVAEMLQTIKNETLSVEIDTKNQKYFIPKNLAEAFDLMNQHPQSVILNGSSDIALRVTKKNEFIPTIIDLSGIHEIKNYSRNDQSIVFGAGICLEEVREIVTKDFPALYDMLSVFGSLQIRNRATFGGNLGSASPIGDTIPVLMALDAELTLKSISGERAIKVRDFITGYRQTQLKKDELISSVSIPFTPSTDIVKSYKVSKRKDLDISTVSACFRIKKEETGMIQDICLVFGGMAATTRRAEKTELFLKGKRWIRENVEEAMKIIQEEYSPVSDARSGAEARTIMAKNLLMKFYQETAEEL